MSDVTVSLSEDHTRASVNLPSDARLTAEAVDGMIRQLVVARMQMSPAPPDQDPQPHIAYLPAVRMFAGRDQASAEPVIHVLLLVPGLGWTGIRMDATGMQDMLQHIEQLLRLPPSQDAH